MTDNRLKSLAERIERLMDERDGIASDIRDIYTEAKSAGYIPKALRKVIARLRMDPAKLAEDDTLIELYEAALGPVGKAMKAVREGATWQEASEATGVPRATLARAEAVSKRREMIPELETGAATVVATGNLDAQPPEPREADAESTTSQTEAEALAAMEAAGERLRQMRAERGL
jgi:uncharacterized protein (UPF0335 family)